MNFKLKQARAKTKLTLRLVSYWYEYLLWLFFSPNKFSKGPKKFKKVLIMNWGALGDNFVTLRTAINVARENPDKQFYLMLPKEGNKNLKWIEGKSDIKIVDENYLLKNKFDVTLLFSAPKKLLGNINLGYVIGNEYHSVKSSLMSHRYLFVNDKIPPKWRHKIRQEIEICKRAGLKFEKLEDFNEFNKKGKNKYAIIHPSGRNFSEIVKSGGIPNLAWPFKRFSKIADYLVEKYGFNVIITGSKEEKSIGDIVKIGVKNKKKVYNHSGKMNIEELTKIIGGAEILVGIDTSAIHIAEFTNTPVVALFGPTFREEVGAYGSKKQINLSHPDKCIRDRKKGPCDGGRNVCMESISVEDVKKAIDKVI